MKQFIQDTDFFQRQNKPVFSFMEDHLYYLSAFLKSNCNSSNFGLEIKITITSHNFDLYEFYSIFRLAFREAQNKFNAHISSHPAHSFFQVAQIFNPKYILLDTLKRKNLSHYSFIRELANPSDELLCK